MTKGSNGKSLVLRLYVAGRSPYSTTAVRNLRAMCDKHLNDEYELEIVDVVGEPSRALNDGVLVTPTLMKLKPEPTRTLLGDLSDESVLLATLGLVRS
jgi:circadian clock protein KaiB